MRLNDDKITTNIEDIITDAIASYSNLVDSFARQGMLLSTAGNIDHYEIRELGDPDSDDVIDTLDYGDDPAIWLAGYKSAKRKKK
jgi:hypothetical protein